jgi:hypothetical protein
MRYWLYKKERVTIIVSLEAICEFVCYTAPDLDHRMRLAKKGLA